MESMLDFVSVIIIIFGILQIILFFKLWGMTNNVGKIQKKLKAFSGRDLEHEIRRLILIGDIKSVEALLMDSFIKEVKWICVNYESTEGHMSDLAPKYSKYYEKIGSKLPDSILNIKSKEDFYEVFPFSM